MYRAIAIIAYSLSLWCSTLTIATAQSPRDYKNPDHREACNAKLRLIEYYNIEDLSGLEAEDLSISTELQGKCYFEQLKHAASVGKVIDKLNVNTQGQPVTVNISEDNEIALKTFRNDMLDVARQLLAEASDDGSPTGYYEAVLKYGPQLSYASLRSEGKNILPKINNVKNAFNFEISDTLSPQELFENTAYDKNWNIKNAECDSKCSNFIDLVIFSEIWAHIWSEHATMTNLIAIHTLDVAEAKFEKFFFEIGDGLYPWELILNNAVKSGNMLEPPNWKLNLAHPTPIIYYDDLDGNIDPGMLIEVFGATKIDYENNFHWGAAAAIDLKDDQVRYGAVLHLPLKAIVGKLGVDGLTKAIPCNLCSIAFMTDSDDDWSIGLKIDVARLLYSQDNLLSEVIGSFD